MSTTATKTIVTKTVEAPKVTQKMVTVQSLRDILLTSPSGNTFINVEADFCMDDKGKMRKTNNPFHGLGYRKLSKINVMVNFSYENAMENRGDSAKGLGNWAQAITVDGKLTPLSVNKKDVNAYDDDNNPIDINDDAKVYLRGEDRGTKSVYVDANGVELSAETVKELKTFLPKRKPMEQETVHFRLITLNNLISLTTRGIEYKLLK